MLDLGAFSFVEQGLAFTTPVGKPPAEGAAAIEAAILQRECSEPGSRGAVISIIDGYPRRFTLLPRIKVGADQHILPLITWRYLPEDAPECSHVMLLVPIVKGRIELPDGYFPLDDPDMYRQIMYCAVLDHLVPSLLKIREETRTGTLVDVAA